MTSFVDEVTVSNLESRVQRKLSALPSTSNESTLVSGITIGLALRLCGATGVMIRLPEFGKIIGPPQLKEYPVDPVGVATINPSAQ
jgi:hypothetical protein